MLNREWSLDKKRMFKLKDIDLKMQYEQNFYKQENSFQNQKMHRLS